MICPTCKTDLTLAKTPEGAFWYCLPCEGVAVNLAVLRKYFDAQVVRDFWRHMQKGRTSHRACPSCKRPQQTFTIPINDQGIELDLCKTCQIVWFDKDELQAFPRKPIPEDSLSPEAKQKLALLEVQHHYDLENSIGEETTRAEQWLYGTGAILQVMLRLLLRI